MGNSSYGKGRFDGLAEAKKRHLKNIILLIIIFLIVLFVLWFLNRQ